MAELIYQLQCGSCGEQSFVSAQDAVIVWDCTNCGEQSVTSLPTTTADSGELIDDPNVINTIVPPDEVPNDSEIIDGVAN